MTQNNNKTSLVYAFDIDGTICSEEKDYRKCIPYPKRIKIINELFDKGNTILIFTGRGGVTKKDWKTLTNIQLKKWGLKYHKLITKIKPYANIFVDDRAINADIFFGRKK